MRLRYDTFHELVSNGFYVDGHPGGIQVFLWYWVKLFGESEAAVRLPFVLAGILSVYLVFKIGKYAFGSVSGLYAAAAMAFLQFPVLYSQIARPYGSGVLFALLFLWFWIQLVFQKEQCNKRLILNLCGFTISAALCMYNHYFSFLFALLTGLTGLFLIPRKRLLPYIIAALVAAILFIPHLYITLNHLSYKGVGFWLGKPTPDFLIQHIYFIFDSSLFTLIIILLAALFLIFLGRNDKSHEISKMRIIFAVLFLLPVIVGYIYSVLEAPVLQNSVLIFSFPLLLLLLFSFGESELTKYKIILLLIFLSAGITGTVSINKYYSKQHFGEFKNIAVLSAEFSKKISRNLNIVISTNNPDYLKYYFKKIGSEPEVSYLNINDTAGLRELKNIVANSEKEYFLFAWTKTCPGEYQDIIKSYYPELTFTKKYGKHSLLSVYGRVANNEIQDNYKLINVIDLFKTTAGAVESFQEMDSGTEYSKGLTIDIDTLEAGGNYRLESSGTFKSDDSNLRALFVISVEQDGKSLIWSGNPLWWFLSSSGKSNAFNHIDFRMPPNKNMKIKCYFWNREKQKFMYQNIKLTIRKNTLKQKDDDFVLSFPK